MYCVHERQGVLQSFTAVYSSETPGEQESIPADTVIFLFLCVCVNCSVTVLLCLASNWVAQYPVTFILYATCATFTLKAETVSKGLIAISVTNIILQMAWT